MCLGDVDKEFNKKRMILNPSIKPWYIFENIPGHSPTGSKDH